jgi:hypothetical protein
MALWPKEKIMISTTLDLLVVEPSDTHLGWVEASLNSDVEQIDQHLLDIALHQISSELCFAAIPLDNLLQDIRDKAGILDYGKYTGASYMVNIPASDIEKAKVLHQNWIANNSHVN